MFPQGLREQKIGSLLVVPPNLWEQLFPQSLWEHQMKASYWLFPQICRNRLLFMILLPGAATPYSSPFLSVVTERRSKVWFYCFIVLFCLCCGPVTAPLLNNSPGLFQKVRQDLAGASLTGKQVGKDFLFRVPTPYSSPSTTIGY